MTHYSQSSPTHNHNKVAKTLIIVLVFFLALLLAHLYNLKLEADTERTVTFKEGITKMTDVVEIKKRMRYHGCLVCWEDLTGEWWFHRDGEQCKLGPPK